MLFGHSMCDSDLRIRPTRGGGGGGALLRANVTVSTGQISVNRLDLTPYFPVGISPIYSFPCGSLVLLSHSFLTCFHLTSV